MYMTEMQTYVYILIAVATLFAISRYQPPLPNGSELTRMIRLFLSITYQIGLEFWAIGGTALGVYKNAEVLPFDDDLDFGVRDISPSQLDSLRAVGKVIETRFGYRITHPETTSAINLFVFTRVGDRLLPTHWVQETFKEEWFYTSEVQSTTPVMTSMGAIPMPNGVATYLHRQYPEHMTENGFSFA